MFGILPPSDWDFQPKRPLRSLEIQQWDSIKRELTIPCENRGQDLSSSKLNSNGLFFHNFG